MLGLESVRPTWPSSPVASKPRLSTAHRAVRRRLKGRWLAIHTCQEQVSTDLLLTVEASELWHVALSLVLLKQRGKQVFFPSVSSPSHLTVYSTARISVTSYFSTSVRSVPCESFCDTRSRSRRKVKNPVAHAWKLKVFVYFAVNHWPSSSDMSF